MEALHIDTVVLLKSRRQCDGRLADKNDASGSLQLSRHLHDFESLRIALPASGTSISAAILDALPKHIVLIDSDGVIVSANKSWRAFAATNGYVDDTYGIGSNYLAVCDGVVGKDISIARRAAAGIRSVLRGNESGFSLEYACDSAIEKRWFLLTVAPLNFKHSRGAVAMHLDITERKLSEDALRRFAAAMAATPDAIYIIDRLDMCMIYVNEAGCQMHGATRDELLSSNPWEPLCQSREELEGIYDRLIINGTLSEPVDAQMRCLNGELIWTEIRRRAELIAERWTIIVSIRDVTARRETQSRIAYLNRIYAILSRINALILRVRDRSELFREACRIAVDDGQLAIAWIGMIDPTSKQLELVACAGMDAQFTDSISRLLSSNTPALFGGLLSRQAIDERQPIVFDDAQNDATLMFGKLYVKYDVQSLAILPLIVADATVGIVVLHAREKGFFQVNEMSVLIELAGDVAFAIQHIEKQDRLDYLAYYDVVTGLANRALFLERTTQHLSSAATHGRRVGLCLIDLEGFKNFNDSLGRQTGDALLVQVAQWLASQCGGSNLISRLDSDRFAMLMPDVLDTEEIARRLGTLISALTNHSFELNKTQYRIAARYGIAVSPDDGAEADTLCKHAEAALKKAKIGRERYLFYTQTMTEKVSARLGLENQLRQALSLNQFELHYQPKFNTVSGTLSGAEALIRWNDPCAGLTLPGRFISILEDTGLINEVGQWALHKALDDYLRWRSAGLNVVRIAVNLSALQLKDRYFIANMRDMIGTHPGAADGLELEITESLIMENVDLSIKALGSIREMGVRIAIDDFGTGFSSLSYLSKLPVDTVKIDRSFVSDMTSGSDGLSLVSLIINLARSLRLRVVAEGVETEEQARLLRLLGSDEVQGFLFGRPVSGQDFAERYLTADGSCSTTLRKPPIEAMVGSP
jgi:diguanylate cyclase (GGDEF)-like protein/PAS domain S-box-containing protein